MTTTTTQRTLGVGLVGANPEYGWAFRAHVPALRDVPGARVTAVSTTREESARSAADILGISSWYVDAADLAADPAVDLVVISVKVPHHVALVETVLAAGKHVYCEWPLTQTTAEAERLAARADAAGVQGFVGLQSRADPVITQARSLIAAGAVGEITGLTARSSAYRGADGTVDAERIYTLDAANGAGDVEVQGGHLLDVVDQLAGGIEVTDGATATTREAYRVQETDEMAPTSSPDVFRAGLRVGPHGIGSVQAWYGDPAPGTEITIQGTAGRARLWTEHVEDLYARQPQMAPFAAEIVTPQGTTALDGTPGRDPQAANVAATYRQVVADLADGDIRAPRFADAVRVHRMLDVVRGHRDTPRTAE